MKHFDFDNEFDFRIGAFGALITISALFVYGDIDKANPMSFISIVGSIALSALIFLLIGIIGFAVVSAPYIGKENNNSLFNKKTQSILLVFVLLLACAWLIWLKY